MKQKLYDNAYILTICLLFQLPTFALEIPTWMTLKKKEIKNEVWPEIHIVATIDTDPLTSTAIFAAYDYQKHYIPDLKESKVILEKVQKKTNETHVKYTFDMPWPLSDGHYVHGHEITKTKKGSFQVRWFLVESDSAELVRGEATFSPHPTETGKTQLTYVSLVRPKSFLAGIFKKIMVGDVI